MNSGESKLTVIEKKRDDGLYVWMSHSGDIFKDRDGNVMNIPAVRNDITAMNKILKAAHHYGAPDGRPHFVPGVRRVSDMEYSEQIGRMKEGYIPSETDLGAWYDAQRSYQKHGRNYDD